MRTSIEGTGHKVRNEEVVLLGLPFRCMAYSRRTWLPFAYSWVILCKSYSKKKHKGHTLMGMRNWELFNVGFGHNRVSLQNRMVVHTEAFCLLSHYMLNEHPRG